MATHSILSFSFRLLLFYSSLALVSIVSSPSFPLPDCHEDEASALLQFKHSLTIDMCVPSAYPKLESWKMLGGRSDCCSWDGVECDAITGHVTALHLSNSCLQGPLSFNSTLSKLSKLRLLSLAFNNFSHSSIPSLDHFSHLTYLNLSNSGLSGLVPPSISQLSKLVALDLSSNDGLILKKQHFEALVKNLTRLEYLDLDWVDISSTIPKSMLNLSSLNYLQLHGCGLFGQFPAQIFTLPNLIRVILRENSDLGGYFPQFNSSSPIEYLAVDWTRFGGLLPASIGKLPSLHYLDIEHCSFYGKIPKLFENPAQLTVFVISNNFFEGTNSSNLSWLGRQNKLYALGLQSISLKDDIPAYLANLTKITFMDLHSCQLSGPLPHWLLQMNKLQLLDLGFNQLQGPIPSSFSQLTQLSVLNLEFNKLSGKVELNMSTGFEELFLSGNNLSLIQEASTNASLNGRKFYFLGLGSCNLQHFPQFLHDQDQLTWLDLSNNDIHGKIPLWLWNLTRDTLNVLNVEGNYLTGFELDPIVFPWPRATMINLNHNMFHGPLPMPPENTKEFFVSENNFQGQISSEFCSLNSFDYLDLSNNNLSGKVPQCLAHFSPSLENLDLGGNNFQGGIPRVYTKDCNLKMLMLDNNNFKGKLPKSLFNCSGLELLVLSNNQIDDAFPSWLGALKQLQVLDLWSNHFHGELKGDRTSNQFQQLRMIDLSWNNLSGSLPAEYFFGWKAMEIDSDNNEYLENIVQVRLGSGGQVRSNQGYLVTLTNKGIKIDYNKILESFAAIDLSGNRFEGNIPISICNLRGLHLLNLSNNFLTGSIPSLLVNLSNLEALDLSQNNLSGEIPLELARLTFLSFFNVSYNHLVGPIPHGNQFEVFQNNSYQGNSRLCGSPLSKQCGILPLPPSSVSEEDASLFHFGWLPVVIGYVCGFLFGIGLGYLAYTRKHAWIVNVFWEKQRRMNVVRGIGQLN